MDSEQAKRLVSDTFRNRFEKSQFLLFVRNLLNHLDDSDSRRLRQAGPYIKRAFQDRIKSLERLGTYSDPDGNKLDVLLINLQRETTLERGRTSLRNFVADYLSTGHGSDKDAVLAAFVSPDPDDWRFSYVKLEYSLQQTDSGRVTEKKELTPARRYSFLVGRNERSHTAQKQFLPLLENVQSDPTLSEIEKAFDIEKVTKEFFQQYKDLFENVRDSLNKILRKDQVVREDFKKKSIDPDDFAKKLLGQIVFLYFLQKKGWFGVEPNAAWGTGNRYFLRYLFDHRSKLRARQERSASRPVNFFNDVLEHLFYDALARERDDDYYARFDCRIPFLNGGLFEPLFNYDWVNTEILLPDSLFSNGEQTEEGDEGTGILDVFDRFNFTVNEAEPLEKEVAVDPEMLGKVFENLLPENLRHKAGTYYTPRPVVHYMCQQSLINYLTANLDGDDGQAQVAREDVETFIRIGYAQADFEAAGTEAHRDRFLPESVSRAASRFDKLLERITVCDPAVGSGAFLVGMMQEIVRAREALATVQRSRELATYELKRHCIQKSLYGVDIDPGAVEIAKLRLWLSLVVDEDDRKQIQALPNLDYKIMQGNSLLEEFEGVKLLEDNFIEKNLDNGLQSLEGLKQQIATMREQAIQIRRTHGARSPQAVKQEEKIDKLLKQLGSLITMPKKQNEDLFISESKQKLALLKLRHKEFFDETSPEKKKRLRETIESLEWDFMEAKLKEDHAAEALQELARHRRDNRRNYFLWLLHFFEVFEASRGFDVVIGNPPYLNVERVDPQTKQAYARRYKTFYKRYDVFGLFFEQALTHLVERGTVALIIPSQILNNLSYKKLRDLMLSNGWLKEVFYLGDKVFESVNNDVCVLFLQKPLAKKIRLVNALDFAHPTTTEVTPNYFDKFDRVISFSGDAKSDSIFDRIFNRQFVRTRDNFDVFQGIVTGNNPMYLLTDEQIKEARIEKEVLHPVLLGRDFEKWHIRNTNRRIIYLDANTDVKKFPHTEEWLKPHKKELMKRRECQRGVIPWYSLQWPRVKDQFDYTPKILVQGTRNPRLKTRIVAALDEVGFYGVQSINFIVPKKAAPIRYLLAILNSSLINYLYQTKFLNVAIKAEYLKDTPLPNATASQMTLVATLVDYISFLKSHTSDREPQDQRVITYFEQIIDALVYELYLTDEIHESGKQFFQPLMKESIPPLQEIKGNKVTALREIFNQLFDRDHLVRQNIFFLDTVESVRIVEGKA